MQVTPSRPSPSRDGWACAVPPGPFPSVDVTDAERDCTVIHPNVAMRAALFAVCVLCGIVGVGMVVAGLVSLRHPGPATALLPLGAFLVMTIVNFRSVLTAPSIGRLSLRVCPQRLVFERTGHAVDTVEKAEVGVVIIDGYTPSGVLVFAVYGSGRDLVGMWDTGWTGKSPRHSMHVLDQYGYPWVTPGLDKIWRRSPDAPGWADEVDYLAPRLSRHEAQGGRLS